MKKLLLSLALVVAAFCSKAQSTYTYEINPHGDGIYGLSWYEDIYGTNILQYTQDMSTVDFSYIKFVIDDLATGATPNTISTAVVGVDDDGVLVRIAPVLTYLSSGTRSFNTAYQISTTTSSTVKLSSQISCSLSLVTGQAGQVILEVSANGSSGWNAWGILSASNTGTLSLGVNTVQISGGMLEAELPAGYYWKLRTSNTTGSPTFTFLGGVQETY